MSKILEIVGWSWAGIFAMTLVTVLLGSMPSYAQTDTAERRSESQRITPEYQRHIEDGARYNAEGDFRNAEASYRHAVTICQNHYRGNAAACSDVLIRLGLEISNQQRFDEADEIFETANALAQRATSSFAIPRYLVYRAMDMSNREQFGQARLLILAANKRYSVLLKREVGRAGLRDQNTTLRLDALMHEFAHGLFVQAGVARQLGRMKEVELSVRLAKNVAVKLQTRPQALLNNLDRILHEPPRRNLQSGQKLLEATESDQ